MVARRGLMTGAALGLTGWSSMAAAQPADPAALLASLMALEKASWQYVKDRNLAGMQNYLADDGLLIFGDGSRYTKAEFLKVLADFRLDSFTIDGRGQGLEPGRRQLALPDHLRQRYEGRQGGHAQGDLGQHLRPPQRQVVERALSGDSDTMKVPP
jgi:hypothetical protein